MQKEGSEQSIEFFIPGGRSHSAFPVYRYVPPWFYSIS